MLCWSRSWLADAAEFISEFAEPFPHQALCAFVGWPVADWNRVRGWTHGNQEVAFRQDHEAGAVLAHEFAAYVTEILDARRARVGPAEDLMNELLGVVVAGKSLSNEDIVSLLRTWTAGHGTVASALGIVAHPSGYRCRPPGASAPRAGAYRAGDPRNPARRRPARREQSNDDARGGGRRHEDPFRRADLADVDRR